MFVSSFKVMETFINKVRQHPCLWDNTMLDYRDIAKKDSIWSELAHDCNLIDGKHAKLLWKRLRDSHREAIRRRRLGAASMRPWKYEHAMEFVLQERPEDHYEETVKEEGEEEESRPEPFASHYTSTPMTLRNMEMRLQTQTDEPRQKRQRFSQACLSNTDPLLDLFSSLYKKTCKLPRSLRLKVQREMFEAVTRAEEEALAEEDSNKEDCLNVEGDAEYIVDESE